MTFASPYGRYLDVFSTSSRLFRHDFQSIFAYEMTVHVSHKEIQFAHLIALAWRNEQRIRMQKYMSRHGATSVSINTIDINFFAIVQYGHVRQLHGHISNDCRMLNENKIVQRNTSGSLKLAQSPTPRMDNFAICQHSSPTTTRIAFTKMRVPTCPHRHLT